MTDAEYATVRALFAQAQQQRRERLRAEVRLLRAMLAVLRGLG